MLPVHTGERDGHDENERSGSEGGLGLVGPAWLEGGRSVSLEAEASGVEDAADRASRSRRGQQELFNEVETLVELNEAPRAELNLKATTPQRKANPAGAPHRAAIAASLPGVLIVCAGSERHSKIGKGVGNRVFAFRATIAGL